MEGVMKTMNAAECAEFLRAKGMKISPEIVRLGIQQGQFPFGVCIESKTGAPICTIFEKLLRQWAEERI